MSHPVRLGAFAKQDIALARDWYDAQELGLGDRFLDRVNEAVTRIRNNPFQYQQRIDDARRARVEGFPYGLWYRVLPDHSIVIACLAHRQEQAQRLRRRIRQEPEPT